MSFTREIYTIMTADPSLNDLVDGGVHYENLIDNWLGETTEDVWIVYEQRITNQQDCVNKKNAFLNYALSVVVIQRNTNNKIDTITNRLIAYLNNHESGNIYDIAFTGDQGGFNQQQQIYTNTLEFLCTYVEN
jgi:Tfp pilus assembly PilM family ATPase